MKINIIMFNMSKYSDWQKGIANRNFHILHNLAKSDQVNKIIAVDFLPFNFKRKIKSYIFDQIIGDTRGSIVYGSLLSRCWQVSSKTFAFSTVNKHNLVRELNKVIDQEEMNDNLIVWNYNPLYTDYLNNKLKQKLNIFDAVDDWSNHSSYKNFKNTLEKNYQTIKNRSDLIFTVSQSLQNELFEAKDKVYWIANGVDLQSFQNETKVSARLNDIKKPIIGFLGILQDRIDIDIIKYLAKNNSDKSIVLAGPVWQNFPKNQLNQYKNINFLGPIPYSDIPSLYNGFDVGIVPYKVNEFTKSIDPMKYYEYLAAGLPVVTTPVAGYERFSDYIKVAETPEDFDKKVNEALIEGKNNSSQEFLKEHTWQLRIKKMLKLINEKI